MSETKSSKFLGVYIDNSLNRKEYISYISDKISHGIGVILKSRKFLNEESLLTLYFFDSHIVSWCIVIIYGEIVMKQTCPNCRYYKTGFCVWLLVLSLDVMLTPCIQILEFIIQYEDKIINVKFNLDHSKLFFKVMLKKCILQTLVACKWSVYSLQFNKEIYIHRTHSSCMGNSISNSVLPPKSIPLHPV